MALKQEIILWDEAVKFHDAGDLGSSLQTFNEIPDTSRILFNCGVIHASLGEHAEAAAFFRRAVARDQYLAVAYFQCGVSNFLLGEFEEALSNFNDTILCLRGNASIDYDQLGLKYQLHFCEALFNRGLCYIYLQQKAMGMADLRHASTKKMTPDHNVIDEAIQEEAEGFVVFSIPRGIIYRPNAAKVKNLTSKNYLGKARLIAAQQERRNQSMAPALHTRNRSETAIAVDPGREQVLNGITTNVMRPGQGLPFRSRQQSEPPRNRRELFPPTPPPEEVSYKPESNSQRRNSGSSSSSSEYPKVGPRHQRSKSRPIDLELGAAAFQQSQQKPAEKPRLGTMRSASEQPRARVARTSPTQERRIDAKRRSLRVDTREDSTYVLKPTIYDAVNRSPDNALATKSDHHNTQSAQQPQFLQPVTYTQHCTKSNSKLETGRPVSIEEECEDDNDNEIVHPDSAVSGIPPAPVPNNKATDFSSPSTTASPPPSTGHTYQPQTLLPYEIPRPDHVFNSAHAAPPKPEVVLSRIRVKVHGERDTRYVILPPAPIFQDFVEQVRKKFGLLCGRGGGGSAETSRGEGVELFKLKIRDEEGDMVTLGDQEDLDMAVQGCRDAIAASGVGEVGVVGPVMGKLEVWVHEI